MLQTHGGVMYAGGAAGGVAGLRLWWGITNHTNLVFDTATVTIWRTGSATTYHDYQIILIFNCVFKF